MTKKIKSYKIIGIQSMIKVDWVLDCEFGLAGYSLVWWLAVEGATSFGA